MFPHGGPGVGLLLLRLATAIVVINEPSTRFGTTIFYWICVTGMVLAACLVVGFMTPVTSTVGFIFQIADLVNPNMNVDAAQVVAFALAFLALVLLGPGAYSVDGYLFGRRVLVRPDDLE
jgi:uncharacterized membrane protein YphA (DoxX/SURF4 family)